MNMHCNLLFPLSVIFFVYFGSIRCNPSLLTRDPVTRPVYFVIEYDLDTSRVSREGDLVMQSHSFLFVAGNDWDGPLKMEIGSDPNIGKPHDLYIRAFDLTTANKDKTYYPIPDKRHVAHIMDTAHSNRDFIHPTIGNGFVANAWTQDVVYRSGVFFANNINNCHTFVRRLVEGQLGGRLDQTSLNLIDKGYRWVGQFKSIRDVQVVYDLRLETATPGQVARDARNGLQKFLMCNNGIARRDQNCRGQVSVPDHDATSQVEKFSQQNELALDSSDYSESDLAADDPDTYTNNQIPDDTFKTAKVSLVRSGGILTTFTAVGKEALAALGVAGDVIGAAFVILDFVNHQWVGGAIGALGTVAGVAAGLAISGPLGWVIGGALIAFFASKFKFQISCDLPSRRGECGLRMVYQIKIPILLHRYVVQMANIYHIQSFLVPSRILTPRLTARMFKE